MLLIRYGYKPSAFAGRLDVVRHWPTLLHGNFQPLWPWGLASSHISDNS